jgi:hypothetical protein
MRHIREILRMKWSLKRSHREAARSLGISAGAVASVLSRATAIGLTLEMLEGLTDEALALHFVSEAFKHGKPIGATSRGIELLRAARLDGVQLANSGDVVASFGVVTVAGPESAADKVKRRRRPGAGHGAERLRAPLPGGARRAPPLGTRDDRQGARLTTCDSFRRLPSPGCRPMVTRR